MNDIQRRAFMQGAGLGALAFTVGGVEVMLTPRQARADNVPLQTLTADQAATREIAFLLSTYPDVVRTALRTHELTDVAMFALRLGSCMRSSGDLLLTNERASQRLADRTVQEE